MRRKTLGYLASFVALVIGLSVFPALPGWAGNRDVFDDKTAIDRFFRGRALDSIEGIWKWETKHGKYQGAIIRLDLVKGADKVREKYGDKIQYACYLTKKVGTLLPPGALKMVLKGESGGIHKGYYIMYQFYRNSCFDADEIPFSISRVSSGTLAMGMTLPEGETVINEAVRVYPKETDLFSLSVEEVVGTGFFVAPGIVVTTCNNVVGASAVAVRFRGREMEATVLVKDSTNDLALLKVVPQNSLLPIGGRPLPIGDARSVSKGAHISAAFFDSGISEPEPGSQEGAILAIAGERNDPRVFETGLMCQGMRNGAPVFNEDYQVIGILTDVGQNPCFRNLAMVPEGICYVVKSNYLFNLAASAQECPRLEESGPVAGMNGLSVFDSLVQIVAKEFR